MAHSTRTKLQHPIASPPDFFFNWDDFIKILKKNNSSSNPHSIIHSHPQYSSSTAPLLHPIRSDTRILPTSCSNEAAKLSSSRKGAQDFSPVFIALDGKSFKGITFVEKAYAQGIRHFIFDVKYLNTASPSHQLLPQAKPIPPSKHSPEHSWQQARDWIFDHRDMLSYIAVTDPLLFLADLASEKLKRLSQHAPSLRIAITGSAGKTSTRHFLFHFFSQAYTVFQPQKNFNNAVGLPLAILSITKPYTVYLFELAMSTPGEIAVLSKIVRPHTSLITSILPSHWEAFTSLQSIAKAKLEILLHQKAPPRLSAAEKERLGAAFPKTVPPPTALRLLFQGKVFYPQNIRECRIIEKTIAKHGLVPSPYDPDHYHSTLTLTPHFELITEIKDKKSHLTQHISSSSPFLTPLAALGDVLKKMIFPPHTHKTTTIFPHVPQRMEEKWQDPKIIHDAYNANPVSMRDTLSAFIPLLMSPNLNYLIFILGDMLELGKKETLFHRQLGQFLKSYLENFLKAQPTSYFTIFCYGPLMHHVHLQFQPLAIKNTTISAKHFLEQNDLSAAIHHNISMHSSHTIALFKGSNGMQLSSIITSVLQRLKENL